MDKFRTTFYGPLNGYWEDEYELDVREYWDELSSNGANLDLPPYDEWIKSIRVTWIEFEKLKGKHHLYGQLESLAQSENFPANCEFDEVSFTRV